MLDLYATTGRATEFGDASRPVFYKECRRPNVYMRIEGDLPVDSFFFDDPELTLVCRADLLALETPSNLAAHLANLYRQKEDGFVRGLRGTFAIVLYDHNQRALKAWIDHFGAERFVYTETGGSLTIRPKIQTPAKAQPTKSVINPRATPRHLP